MVSNKRMFEAARQRHSQAALPDAEKRRPYVIPRHTVWIEKVQDDYGWSEAAIAHANSVFTNQHKTERSGRFSPSSMGDCNRRLLLGYAGAPADKFPAPTRQMFDIGNSRHLWFQMMGITAGWLSEAEIYSMSSDLRIGGTLDGILDNGDIFEFKTAHPGSFNKIISPPATPKFEHVMQIAAYRRITGRQWASLVYEDKGGGDLYEFRIGPDQAVDDKLDELLEYLNGFVDADSLPPMLDECERRIGKVYAECPHRVFCPTARDITSSKDGN